MIIVIIIRKGKAKGKETENRIIVDIHHYPTGRPAGPQDAYEYEWALNMNINIRPAGRPAGKMHMNVNEPLISILIFVFILPPAGRPASKMHMNVND